MRTKSPLILAVLACAAGATPTTPITLNEELPDVRRDATVLAVEEVMPSVVNIATKSVQPVQDPMDRFFPPGWRPRRYGTQYSLGSGVVIDEAGYVLTNEHVVRGASQIQVRFAAGTNDYNATLVVSDPRMDVALLKLEGAPGEKFHPIKLAREDDLLLGETVLALGNPLGFGGSVTRGILSSKSRMPPKEGQPLNYANLLQTDAPINHGNSGGPLVNLRGELIGINNRVVNEAYGEPAQGLGFAIPIRLVEEALSDIFPTEFVKNKWFGARVKVGSYPLTILSVQPDSPADKAGLKPGDAILEVNGKVPRSFIQFSELMATNSAADVPLTIRRGTEQLQPAVKLIPETSVFNADYIQRRLGVALEPQTIQLWGQTLKTFVITQDKNTPAASQKSRFFITTFDGQSFDNLTALARFLAGKRKGDVIPVGGLVVQRDNEFVVAVQEKQAEITLR
ncbi:MAG: trypsin-like peptidase domain-containing protein [Verrucomicrobiota bacterium]